MHPTPDFLTADDLRIPEASQGSVYFETALKRATTREDLFRILGQYRLFNARFGAGVSHLNGAIANSDFFADASDSIPALSDRSGEVTKHVFIAAIDEFGGPDARYPSHSQLAQNFLRGIGHFFSLSPDSCDSLLKPRSAVSAAVSDVRWGYGFGKAMDTEAELFEAMGFHIGSEHLADDEFGIIDRHLRRAQPELVKALEKVDPAIADIAAYAWVKIHTTVEVEHAAHAMEAANLALRYYKGEADTGEMRQQILKGFRTFAEVQSNFFEHIHDK